MYYKLWHCKDNLSLTVQQKIAMSHVLPFYANEVCNIDRTTKLNLEATEKDNISGENFVIVNDQDSQQTTQG